MSKHRFRSSLRHDINVAPLVDVMLVLLVVFMITAPMMNGAVKVHLPKENVGKSADSQSLSLFLDREERLFLCDQPVTREELVERLRVLPPSSTDSLSIHADRQLPYEKVMKIMAFLSKKGFAKLNLVVECVA